LTLLSFPSFFLGLLFGFQGFFCGFFGFYGLAFLLIEISVDILNTRKVQLSQF